MIAASPNSLGVPPGFCQFCREAVNGRKIVWNLKGDVQINPYPANMEKMVNF